jgi:hypothetical protein
MHPEINRRLVSAIRNDRHLSDFIHLAPMVPDRTSSIVDEGIDVAYWPIVLKKSSVARGEVH